jgi:hypothetical protein
LYTRFGQELYLRETVSAARVVAESGDLPLPELAERIAATLPHTSPTTRHRIAIKLLQRLTAATTEITDERTHRSSKTSPQTLACMARLTTCVEDTSAQSDLVYYAACRCDKLIGAIASEILYPYFIENRIPGPFTEDEFITSNANLLLAPEPVITCGFAADYARRVWGFESERTVILALRVMKQAGILMASPLLGEQGRIMAYTLAPHSISLSALMWGLYHEFHGQPTPPAWDQVGRSSVARLFLASSSLVTSKLFEAERCGLVGFWSGSGMRRVHFKVSEPEALMRLLIGGAPSGGVESIATP